MKEQTNWMDGQCNWNAFDLPRQNRKEEISIEMYKSMHCKSKLNS